MPKKSKKEDISEGLTKSQTQNLQEKLIENLIELQKVHTDMAEKFDKLHGQLTNLLTLFEMAARSFAEHPANQGTEKDKEFLDKIDRLLDQNKTIAKGLTLMEDRLRERLYGGSVQQQKPAQSAPNSDEEYRHGSLDKIIVF